MSQIVPGVPHMERERIKVLIAEDEESLRLTVAAWLRDEGFEIHEVSNGTEAIEKIQEQDFDIALLDIKMPRKNGLEVLRYVVKNSIDTDVILMTGMDDITVAVEAIKTGAKEYLTKPLDMSRMGDLIRSLIDKKDADARIHQLQAEHTARLLYDLHNPIAGLKQSIGYLLKGMAGPLGDHQKELLTYMTKTIEKVTLLLNDMVDLTKLEGGRVRLNKGISNPNDSIGKILKEFRLPAEAKKIRLTFQPKPNFPPIEYDQEKIEQVIENLISNALQYTPNGGEITLDVRKDSLQLDGADDPSDFAVLSVKNTGEGISEESFPNLFNRFHQIKSEKHEYKSTGLGLMICQKIIEAHNGKIWAETTRGESATFLLALPIH